MSNAFTIIVACCVALIFVPNRSAGQGAAKLVASESGWDFGRRTQGDKDQKIIRISNTGSAMLEITKIDTSCGCVTPSMKEKQIAPGSSADLVLDLDAARGILQIKKEVFIESNDPGRRKMSLTIDGHIAPVWWMSLSELRFDELSNGKAHERSFMVCVAPGRDVKITSVQCHPAELTARLEPFGEADEVHGWFVIVTFPKNLEAFYFEGIIAVNTDCAVFPFGGMRIFGDIVGSVTVSPESLAFGAMKAGEPKTLNLRVHKEIGDGATIALTHCDDDRVAFGEIKEVDAKKTFEVPVTLTPKPGDKHLLGTLVITVDQPGQKAFEVRYSARVTE